MAGQRSGAEAPVLMGSVGPAGVVGSPGSGELPRWESFPPRDRRLLVELIVQTARRRVRDRATTRLGMGRR